MEHIAESASIGSLQCCINDETDENKKESYRKLLAAHKKDAFVTRDYIYSTFLKCQGEHGRKTQDLTNWDNECDMD